jgi:uncharacterized protein (TIRG00374 family)
MHTKEPLASSSQAEEGSTSLRPTVKPLRRRVLFTVKLLVGVGLVAALFRSADPPQVVETLRSTRPFLFAAVCAMAITDRVLMAFKWNLLLRTRGITISVWQATRLYFVGYLVGSFTPGAVGGDTFRAVALRRFQRTPVVVSTILFERFVGIAVISVFAAVAMPFSTRYLGHQADSLTWLIRGGAVVTVSAVLLSLKPRLVNAVLGRVPLLARSTLARKLREFHGTYATQREHGGTVVCFTLLTTLEVVVLVTINYLAARTLELNVSFGYFLCVMPVVHILLRLPVTIHGVGVQERLFVYFLVLSGFSSADGLAVSLVLRAVELAVIVLPGGLMLCFGRRHSGVHREAIPQN